MSLIPCDFCALRVPEKLSQVTWAWYMANGHRTAYRQRLCVTCFCTNVIAYEKETDYEALTCPACGIDTSRDMDPCYATAFIPFSGRKQLELPTCPACAVEIRVRAQHGAIHLEDQESRGAGASPSTPTTRERYWENLGLNPVEGS